MVVCSAAHNVKAFLYKLVGKTRSVLLNLLCVFCEFGLQILVECNGKLDMVICKNKQDAIRMYNMIEEWCERDKMKYIGFMGDLSYSRYKSDWITKIQKLTNWTRKKITRMSTRP